MKSNHRKLSDMSSKAIFTVLPVVCAGLIIILLVIQVVVSNRLAAMGSHLVEIESDINNLNNEKNRLSEKIASSSSHLTLLQKAREIGFTQPINPMFYTSQQSVAFDGSDN